MPPPVPQVVDKLKDWNKIVPVAVTLPVALSLDQGLLDLGYQSLVAVHDHLQLLVLLLLLVR